MKLLRLVSGIMLISLMISIRSDGQSHDPTTLVFPTYLHSYGIRKATKFHLFLLLQNRVQFRDPQSLAAVRLDAWDDLTTKNDDDEVTVYGVNSGQNNIIYNTSMTGLGVYGLNETGPERLSAPHGIAANAKGDVYVADTGNHRVARLYNPGHALKFAKSIGSEGSTPGNFRSPHGLSLDSGGRLYVTDRDNHRIQIFDAQNRFLAQFGFMTDHLCRLISPTGIAVIDSESDWNFHHDNFIVVIDSMSQRLQKLSLDGRMLTQTDGRAFGYPNANLQWPAIDYYGQVYVTDKENNCLHKFDHRLKYLTKYGRRGKGDKEFIEPTGITIFRRFGQVFVAEAGGAQYYWIGVDVYNFDATFESEKKRIQTRFFLTEPAFLTADVYDDQNEFVTRICNKRFLLAGFQYDYWDLRIRESLTDSSNDRLLIQPARYRRLGRAPDGQYTIKCTFEPTYSAFSYFSIEKSATFRIELNK